MHRPQVPLWRTRGAGEVDLIGRSIRIWNHLLGPIAALAILIVACSDNAAPMTTTSTIAPSTSAVATTTTTTTVESTTTTVAVAITPPAAWWRPEPGTTWQWQLTGEIDTSVEAEMFDVDLFDAPVGVVQELHDQGRIVVCYLSAGAWEGFRPDAEAFPEEILGLPNGWDEERWMDIRALDVIGPIIEARLDLCVEKGFDGVETDNVDGFANDTGFPLTAADQLAFNTFLAEAAHARGLSIGLKNDLEQVAELEPLFDWAINEECFEYEECGTLLPFIEAGKAVFHVEYEHEPSAFCPLTVGLGFSSMAKGWDLDASREYCPVGAG